MGTDKRTDAGFGMNERRNYLRRTARAMPVYLLSPSSHEVATSATALDWSEEGLAVVPKDAGRLQVGDKLKVMVNVPAKVKAKVVYIRSREDTKDTLLGLAFEGPVQPLW